MYAIPAWLFALLIVGLMSLLAAAAVIVVRRRFWVRTQNSHNDVAGPIIGMVGTVLAVMLSFMVVTEWQQFDQAAAGVQTEASSVIDLFHLSEHMPKKVADPLQNLLHNYVDRVIYDEWPRMRRGQRSASAHQALYAIVGVLAAYDPKTSGQLAVQQQALELTRTLADARRQRLFDNDQSVPSALWVTLLFLGFTTIAFCCFFRVPNERIHVFMTVAVAAVIGAMFVLIIEFDLPFRGDVHVTPAAFDHAHEVVTRTEATR